MKLKIIIIGIILLILIPLAIHFYFNRDGSRNDVPTNAKNDSPISLNKEKQKLLEDLVKNKHPLVEQDQKLKDALIKQPNPLLQKDEYVVTYDQKDDMFQVEIKTIKISTVKDEVVAWFKDKGFSGAAVCVLPIQFSLDKPSAESLRGTGVVFNPLPPGC